MKFSLNFLKDYVKIKLTPEKLAEKLTLAGLEVKNVSFLGKELDERIVVGEIKTIIHHPSADKLSVCKVEVDNKEVLNIVCGAPNIEVNQKVVVALEGAKLAGGIALKKAMIRGVVSEGMICAEDELGWGEDHTGIVVLDKRAKKGERIIDYLGGEDVILDLDLTPNRSDCYSVMGLAREIAALTNEKLRRPTVKLKETKEKTSSFLKVRVLNKKLCPKYTARVIKSVKVGESPLWLRNRLAASGIRPINNIVDITNYVMLETSQPLHAFDKKKVEGGIVVRQAKKGESLVTLDDQKRRLKKSMLVIADKKKVLALAGVMGGKISEIKAKTREIILESAIFTPVSIRRTSRALGLVSESSLRFERGLDSKMTEEALDRAAQLIQQLGRGKVLKDKIVVTDSQKKVKKILVNLNLTYLKNLLGLDIKMERGVKILESLGFKVLAKNKEKIKVEAPSWRLDIKIPADLVEEMGRIYDYNRLKPTFLHGDFAPPSVNKRLKLENKVKKLLVGLGFDEVLNYSFYGQDLIDKLGLKKNGHLTVSNPINPSQAYLRKDLVPRLLENLEKNSQNMAEIHIFEIGKVFLKSKKGLPQEKNRLVGLMARQEENVFYHLKGVMGYLLVKLGLDFKKVEFKPINSDSVLSPGVVLNIGQKELGRLGELDPRLKSMFKVHQKKVGLFILKLDDLERSFEEGKKYQPISPYPSVVRDLALVVDKGVKYQAIEEMLMNFHKLVDRVEYLSTYPLKEGKKSLAIRIVYQSREKTLSTQEVDNLQAQVVVRLRDKFGATLR